MYYTQSENSLFSFVAFDFEIKRPLYSKYNFDFCQYKKDFLPNLDINTSKTKIFNDFLVRNNTSISSPFIVKDNLKKYFINKTIIIVSIKELINWVM